MDAEQQISVLWGTVVGLLGVFERKCFAKYQEESSKLRGDKPTRALLG